MHSAELKKDLEEKGFIYQEPTKVSSESGIKNSTGNDCSLGQPAIWYDSNSGEYMGAASFSWIDKGWAEDIPIIHPPGTNNMGGKDGFAINFSGAINRGSERMKTWNNNGTVTADTTNTTYGSSYGSGFKLQDTYYKPGGPEVYSWDHGLMTINFTPSVSLQVTRFIDLKQS